MMRRLGFGAEEGGEGKTTTRTIQSAVNWLAWLLSTLEKQRVNPIIRIPNETEQNRTEQRDTLWKRKGDVCFGFSHRSIDRNFQLPFFSSPAPASVSLCVCVCVCVSVCTSTYVAVRMWHWFYLLARSCQFQFQYGI